MMVATIVTTTALLAAATPLAPCRLDHPAGLRVQARCGSVDVTAGARQIEVGFAVLPSSSAEPGLPVVMLSGGPGQSATRDFVALAPVLERLRMDRDVVLVDARGTGRSTPLRCPDPRPLAEKLAGVGDDALLRECLRTLPVAPAELVTARVVDDLEVVRASLGIERWHVLGVSYGTRVAAAWAAARPERTASLVLDGVAPLDRALGDDVAADMEASLRGLGEGVVADFVGLKAALKDAPPTVTVPHPTTAVPVTLTVQPAVVNMVVRMGLYADETRALLPMFLKKARAGDLAPLAALAVTTVDGLEGAIHPPVNVAVLCAEDVPFLSKAPHPDDAAFDDERISLRASCGDIPRGTPFRPTSIAAPTLLLSGEHDPITPPHHARRAEQIFARKRHLVARGMGHNVLPRGCMPGLVADALVAIDQGKDHDVVDASCLDRLQAFPVFVDGQGPSP
jgi:pimeloyl-ACP methyl ester carboxylesterase